MTYRAAIADGCGRLGGNSQNSVGIGNGTAGCIVTFPTDVSQCIYSATAAALGNGIADPGPGSFTVSSGGGGNVVVRPYNASGAQASRSFHLIVAC